MAQDPIFERGTCTSYLHGISSFHGFIYVLHHSKHIAYCKYGASKLKLTRVCTRPDPAFSSIDFTKWRKAIVKFKDHEASAAHRDAFIVFQASRGTSVSNLLVTNLEKDQS